MEFHGNKTHFAEIFIDMPLSMKAAKTYINKFNSQFDRKIERAKMLKPTVVNTYNILLRLVIQRTIYQNKRNTINKGTHIINGEYPLTWKINYYDVLDYMNSQLDIKLSRETIKNHIKRMINAKLIFTHENDTYNINEKRNYPFLIEINPEILCIRAGKDDEIIEKSNFNFGLLSDVYSGVEQKICSLNNSNEINNKERHLTDVQMRNASQDLQNIFPLQEHLKTRTMSAIYVELPTIDNIKRKIYNFYALTTNEKGKIRSELKKWFPILTKGNSAGDVNNTLQKNNTLKTNKLQQLKNDAILRFWSFFIMLLYNPVRENYMPDTADDNHILYVEQAFKELAENEYYFGSCESKEHVEYQLNKLIKATNSTFNWMKKKQRTNPDFKMLAYPNTFLKNTAGKGKFSFKNSIITVEKTMRRKAELRDEFEKKMSKYADRVSKGKIVLFTGSAIAYMINTAAKYDDEDKRNLVYQKLYKIAYTYFAENHNAQYLSEFKANAGNKYFYKNLMKTGFTPDDKIIKNIFFNTKEQYLQNEINKYLKRVSAAFNSGTFTPNDLMRKYLTIRSNNDNSISIKPHTYNEITLNYLQKYF